MKLVRDRIPELFPEAGTYRQVSGNLLDSALMAKVVEEAAEVLQATSRMDVAEEIADLIEVLYAVAAEAGVTETEVHLIRAAKRAERGGFEEGWVLE